jgi:hypothetical protein
MALLSLKEQQAWIDAGLVREEDFGRPVMSRRRRARIGKRLKLLGTVPDQYIDLIRSHAAVSPRPGGAMRQAELKRRKLRVRGYKPPHYRFGVVENGKLVFKTRKVPPHGWRRDITSQGLPDAGTVRGDDYYGRSRARGELLTWHY